MAQLLPATYECYLVLITMPLGFQDVKNEAIRLGEILDDIHSLEPNTRIRAENALMFGCGVLIAWLDALGIEIDSIWGSRETRSVLVNVTPDTRHILEHRRGFYFWKDILRFCPPSFTDNGTYLLDSQHSRSFEDAKEDGWIPYSIPGTIPREEPLPLVIPQPLPRSVRVEDILDPDAQPLFGGLFPREPAGPPPALRPLKRRRSADNVPQDEKRFKRVFLPVYVYRPSSDDDFNLEGVPLHLRK